MMLSEAKCITGAFAQAMLAAMADPSPVPGRACDGPNTWLFVSPEGQLLSVPRRDEEPPKCRADKLGEFRLLNANGRKVEKPNDGIGSFRGGDWNNGGNDGRWALYVNNAPSNAGGNIGGRCAR